MPAGGGGKSWGGGSVLGSMEPTDVAGAVLEREQDGRGVGIGLVRVERDVIARHDDVAVAARVVDVEEAVRGVPRMKGDAEQPPLVAAGDEAVDVEERRGEHARAVVDHDAAGLQGDEQARVAGVGERHRLVEPGGDGDEADLLRTGRRREKEEKETRKDEGLHGCWACMQRYRHGSPLEVIWVAEVKRNGND